MAALPSMAKCRPAAACWLWFEPARDASRPGCRTFSIGITPYVGHHTRSPGLTIVDTHTFSFNYDATFTCSNCDINFIQRIY